MADFIFQRLVGFLCFFKFGIEAVAGQLQIVEPPDRIFRDVFGKCLPVFPEHPVLNIRHNGNMIELIDGKLAFGIKGTYGFHFIAKKFDAIWIIVGKRKYVNNSSPDGILSGFHHKINPLESVFR